jgi:hypothetical protein
VRKLARPSNVLHFAVWIAAELAAAFCRDVDREPARG